MAQIGIKDSPRSKELRSTLRELGFRPLWNVQERFTRFTLCMNEARKAILVIEHAVDFTWQAWDFFVPLIQGDNDAGYAGKYEELRKWAAQQP
jgi:hypothetical protein